MEKLIEYFKYLKVANKAEVTNDVKKSAFLEVYTVLKSELLQDPLVQFTKESQQWVERMLDYNVPGGKLNRGLSVVDSYLLLKEGNDSTEEEFFLATALGWCVEWAQAAALILDDIMDSSQMRRGRPCWFRVAEVSMIAVNDGIVLRNHVNRILKIHFRKKPYFVDLLGLFTEVEYLTTVGQMIDLTTTSEGKKDLSRFTLAHYNSIVKYKTSYYSFYLPVACALLMVGENLEHHISLKDILVEMGTYFQAQDDYLDCFGEAEEIGKVGTDIQEFKCSWLLVKALERCNEEQKRLLHEHYGKEDPADVATVKALYVELDIKGAFAEFETRIHKELEISIDAHPNKRVQAILKSFLAKIYKRQK